MPDMGSQPSNEYVSRVEALRLLDLTGKGLQALVQRGAIVPKYLPPKNRQFFLRTDVQALLSTRGGSTDMNQVKGLALMALSAARRAEQRLDEVFAHLGLGITPLQRDADAVRKLYEEAKKTPTLSELKDPHFLRYIGGTFFAMDEVYLELVEHVTGDDEPWKVFMDFGNRVTRLLLDEEEPAVFLAGKFFQAGRSHLRHVSYLQCRRMKGRRVAEVVFDGGATAVEELVALLH